MRYLVALSVVCAALGTGCIARSPAENTRERLIADMSLILKSWDKNGDGKLSRGEVQAMVDEFFRRAAKDASGGEMAADLKKQRQEFLRLYANQDTNHDGYLTLDELLKRPLANFDCMDRNHDGKVSKKEVFNGMERCPSVNLDDYAPRP